MVITAKSNGTPRKLLNVSLAHKYGWRAKIKLSEAISLTNVEASSVTRAGLFEQPKINKVKIVIFFIINYFIDFST